MLEEVLRYAMAHDHAPAATAVVRILMGLPDAEHLLHRGPEPGALVLAARHPDRRLRLAAAEAIVRMQPAGQFSGSSFVVDALRYFAATRGTKRVLVGGPRTGESRRIGGYLGRAGYGADTAVTGREMLLMATESPDYEFILVDAGVDRPTLDFLLQQLRHDSRTADLPVGVLASPELLDRARHAVRNDARAEVFLRSHDDESIRWMVDRLVGLSDRDRCSFAERQTQAARAIELLTELCDRPGGKGIYDLSGVDKVGLSAIAIRSLSAKAVGLLGDLGTPEGQSALVELAS